MKNSRLLIINGTQHKLTIDGFGVSYIDGMTLDQYLDNAPLADVQYLAKNGIKIATDNPDYANDISERHEL